MSLYMCIDQYDDVAEDDPEDAVEWEANLDLTLMERRRLELAQLSQVWTSLVHSDQQYNESSGDKGAGAGYIRSVHNASRGLVANTVRANIRESLLGTDYNAGVTKAGLVVDDSVLIPSTGRLGYYHHPSYVSTHSNSPRVCQGSQLVRASSSRKSNGSMSSSKHGLSPLFSSRDANALPHVPSIISRVSSYDHENMPPPASHEGSSHKHAASQKHVIFSDESDVFSDSSPALQSAVLFPKDPIPNPHTPSEASLSGREQQPHVSNGTTVSATIQPTRTRTHPARARNRRWSTSMKIPRLDVVDGQTFADMLAMLQRNSRESESAHSGDVDFDDEDDAYDEDEEDEEEEEEGNGEI